MKENKIVNSKYNTYDEFTLKPNEYFNKEKIVTNCGLFIFNKLVLEPHYLSKIGYQNVELTKGTYNALNAALAKFAEGDETEFLNYVEFLNSTLWLADVLHAKICSDITLKSAKPIPAVQKEKEALLKKHKDDIENGKLDVINDITTKLLNIAKKELEDDQSIELYESGARGSFDNAYRRMQIMVGPVYNAATNKYDVITNSLYDGYDKNDISTIANNVVSAFYPKAIGSGVAGYLTKQINAAFQSVVLDEEGTDCHTKNTRKMTLTKDLINFYMYSYMVEGGKLVQLTPDNQEKYTGKSVNMRVAAYCCGNKPCNICTGNRFYNMNIKNAGLTFSKISGTFLNGRMKGSHDMTVRTKKLEIEDMII